MTSRKELLCNNSECCPSGDCDMCHLAKSDAMFAAIRADELEAGLESAEWFNGDAKKIADEAYLSDLNGDEYVDSIAEKIYKNSTGMPETDVLAFVFEIY